MKRFLIFTIILLLILSVIGGCSEDKTDQKTNVDKDNKDVSNEDNHKESNELQGALVKINSLNDNVLSYTEVSYLGNRIVFDEELENKMKLSEDLDISILEDRGKLKYKMISMGVFEKLLNEGKLSNSTFIIKIKDNKQIASIKENLSYLKMSKSESKESIIENYARDYMYKKVFEIHNPDISKFGDSFGLVINGTKLIKPRQIATYTDLRVPPQHPVCI